MIIACWSSHSPGEEGVLSLPAEWRPPCQPSTDLPSPPSHTYPLPSPALTLLLPSVFFGATRRTHWRPKSGAKTCLEGPSLASKVAFWGPAELLWLWSKLSQWLEASKRSFWRCFRGDIWSMGTSSGRWSKVYSTSVELWVQMAAILFTASVKTLLKRRFFSSVKDGVNPSSGRKNLSNTDELENWCKCDEMADARLWLRMINTNVNNPPNPCETWTLFKQLL